MAVKRLSQYVVPRTNIPFGDTEGDFFQVRGLTSADFLRLAFDHSPAMIALYNNVKSKAEGGSLTPDAVRSVLMEAMKDTPDIIFRGIALAADDPDGHENARLLPLAVQLHAVEEILKLTVRSDAELKKLQEIILRLIQGTTGLFTKLTTGDLLNGGSGKSARG